MAKRTSGQNPANYKTQNGLLKAMGRWCDDGEFYGWLHLNTIYVLINNFGWEETEANRFAFCYYTPPTYYATA